MTYPRQANRSLSPWIWRRFGPSYRTQCHATTDTSYPFYNLTSVGAGTGQYTSANQQTLISSGADIWAVNLADQFTEPEFDSSAETLDQANATINPFGIPSAKRRVAIKAIRGNIDFFPVVLTAGLGDVLYLHVALQVTQSTQKGFTNAGGGGTTGNPVQLLPRPTYLSDLDGRSRLYYRRHLWYFGSFTGVTGTVQMQGAFWSMPMNLTFKRPIVLDLEDQLVLTTISDLQPFTLPVVGVYRQFWLPYLSFLVRTL